MLLEDVELTPAISKEIQREFVLLKDNLHKKIDILMHDFNTVAYQNKCETQVNQCVESVLNRLQEHSSEFLQDKMLSGLVEQDPNISSFENFLSELADGEELDLKLRKRAAELDTFIYECAEKEEWDKTYVSFSTGKKFIPNPIICRRNLKKIYDEFQEGVIESFKNECKKDFRIKGDENPIFYVAENYCLCYVKVVEKVLAQLPDLFDENMGLFKK